MYNIRSLTTQLLTWSKITNQFQRIHIESIHAICMHSTQNSFFTDLAWIIEWSLQDDLHMNITSHLKNNRYLKMPFAYILNTPLSLSVPKHPIFLSNWISRSFLNRWLYLWCCLWKIRKKKENLLGWNRGSLALENGDCFWVYLVVVAAERC